jgi:hypothetical protein
VRLVDHLDGLGPQDGLVPAPVVPAEEKIGAAREHDTNVGLRAAAIASIGGAEGWRCQCRGHVRGTSQVKDRTELPE